MDQNPPSSRHIESEITKTESLEIPKANISAKPSALKAKLGSLKKPGFGKFKNIVGKNLESGNLLHILEAKHESLKTLKEEEELVIDAVLDEIWRNYNDDDNDFLDKDEMEKFIYITLIENGNRKYKDIEDLRNDANF